MSLSASTFRIHRWLGWLVGLQVLIWVAGGVVFSLVPFTSWVKGGDTVKPPSVVLPAGWAERVTSTLQSAASRADVVGIAAVATPQGPALRVSYQAGQDTVIVPADGTVWTPPDAAAVRRFAISLYQGWGTVTSVERLSKVPPRLGIVAETGGRGDVWRVGFDDALATRIYLNGQTGEFVTSRNEAWIWYDFFWRLHIMDYAGGEDFNGTLLRIASVTAFGLIVAGVILAVLAARRRWRVLHKAARNA
ncbi:MAG: PepSY domain-containing protein [Vitreoscilla sp.]|nr:PepSY domain-containing protein [Vitreoscilla sp.]